MPTFSIREIQKPRVIVLTDISEEEPDDKESMVRLMLYSNELDIEGLIATSSVWLNMNRSPIAPWFIEAIVKAYGRVRDNLLAHAQGYPPAEQLLRLTRSGNGNDMAAVGDGKATGGSRMIVDAVDKAGDPRPLWVLIWGGAATLAQALWDVKAGRGEREVAAFVSRLRVYDLDGQDDAGAWMCHTFPDLFYIRNVKQWRGISYRVDGNEWLDSHGPDRDMVSPEWFRTNIRQAHGPLGEEYPAARYLHEGDTPSYLNLLANGLTDPQQTAWGGWGGRFTPEKQKNVRSDCPVSDETRFGDYWMYEPVADRWEHEGRTFNNVYCAIFRWRQAMQNDFAARMDWCVKPFEEANHAPIAAVGDDTSKGIVVVDARPGERIVLDASGSRDPDGDALSFSWQIYREPSSCSFETRILDPQSARAVLDVPADVAAASVHVTLTVRDSGAPPLCSYRRVIVTVGDAGSA